MVPNSKITELSVSYLSFIHKPQSGLEDVSEDAVTILWAPWPWEWAIFKILNFFTNGDIQRGKIQEYHVRNFIFFSVILGITEKE